MRENTENRDENTNSVIVAETIKSQAKSSFSHQSMDRSRHTVTKYLNDEKTHNVINTKLFKRLSFVNHQLLKPELFKLEIEHRDFLNIEFLIGRNTKLRNLEVIYIFLRSIAMLQKSKGRRKIQICQI